jgi:hypothetical protein
MNTDEKEPSILSTEIGELHDDYVVEVFDRMGERLIWDGPLWSFRRLMHTAKEQD